MTINSDNIKIFQADTNTDDPDGGGFPTNKQVLDGVDNNLFPDKSQLDGVYGRVNLRKCFLGVDTVNQDTLFGAHVVFTEIPVDPKVYVCAFQTNGNFGDRRTNAQNHLETYLAEGVIFNGELLERQLQGQRSINVMTLVDGQAPTAGQSLALSYNEGLNGAFTEFVRVISVASVRREFVFDPVSGTTKPLLVHTCELTAALKNNHMGFTPQEYLKGQTNVFLNHSRVRETRVADASKYYSARPLAVAAQKGYASCTVDSIYTYLVPSAQSESPLIDLNMVGRSTAMIKSGSTKSFTVTLTVSSASFVSQIGTGVAKGSVLITLSNGEIITDDGSGMIMKGGVNVGTIRYDTGIITWITDVFTFTGSATISVDPAFPNAQAQHTDFINVTEANRGLLWAYTLSPLPERGTLQVIYTYNNRNYIVYDNGDGTLSGVSTGIGTGTINYESGTVSLSLNAYPDVGSALVFQWGNKLVELNASDNQQNRLNAFFDSGLNLTPKRAIVDDPVVTWAIGSTGYTATVNRLTGEVTGDADGVLLNGVQNFRPKKIAPIGTVFTVNSLLDAGVVPETKVVTGTMSSGTATFNGIFNTIPAGVKLVAGGITFNMSITIRSARYTYPSANSQETGLAEVLAMSFFDKPTSDPAVGDIYNTSTSGLESTKQGTVNYNTGVVTLTPQARFIRWMKKTKVKNGDGYYGSQFRTTIDTVEEDRETVTDIANISLGNVSFNYKTVSDSNVPTTATATLQGYKAVINPVSGYSLSVDKIAFRVNGYNYSLSEGNIVRTTLTSTEGLVVGSYAIVNGVVNLTFNNANWNTNSQDNLINWLMVGVDAIEVPQNFYTFITPIAPIRSGSFQLNILIEGTWRQYVADVNGVINNEFIYAMVNYLTGLVQVQVLRKMIGVSQTVYNSVVASNPDVAVAGSGGSTQLNPSLYTYNSGAGTYDILLPTWAVPSGIKYNAIGLTFLPLDADILKLDPVRLPADGRVPCFRPADVIVLSKDLNVTLNTPMIGNSGNVGDILLSVVKVVDANNKLVGNNEIEVNLDTGDYLVTSEFVGANYVNPIHIKAKAQDMALVQDVQVSGVLTLSVPLIHDYPVGSLVSSAIVVGDKTSRAYNYFELQTFSNQWKDVPEGAAIAAKYNYVAAPIKVTNAGAVKERWALQFTTPTTFNIIGETVGILGSGNVASICKPINPLNNEPYFEIPASVGWGQGWVSGNTLRFNTESASTPIWLVRTILQGQTSTQKDGFSLQLRGDVDNEN